MGSKGCIQLSTGAVATSAQTLLEAYSCRHSAKLPGSFMMDSPSPLFT